MIPRYSRPDMVAIWSPETKFRIWFEIEAHAADAMAELGVIPKDAAKKIWEKGKAAKFDVARIDAIEAEVKHDVIAFLTHLSEIVGPEARFMHSGMTSSDVLDTCFNVQLVRAADILITDIDALLAALKRRAFEHKLTPTVGRSHGIHAEPTTFGLKLAYAYAEFARAKERLVAARKEVATCAISGAVGTFAQVDPRVEAHVAKAMGLERRAGLDPDHPARPPRHVFRDAGRGRLLDRAARHRNPPPAAHRSAGSRRVLLREAEGLLGHAAQAQSGAVGEPHRACPHGARLMPCPPWRTWRCGTSATSRIRRVERMIGPDATVTLDFALARLTGIVDKLVVYPAAMQKNLDKLGGLIHSQRVLIALTQKGVPREDAYRLVQRNAMQVWGGEKDFLALLKADKDVRAKLSDKELEANFNLDHHFKHVDTIFQRVFGGECRESQRARRHQRFRFSRAARSRQFRCRALAILLVPRLPQRHARAAGRLGQSEARLLARTARRRTRRRHASGHPDLPQPVLHARRALGAACRSGPRESRAAGRARPILSGRTRPPRRAISCRCRGSAFRCRRWSLRPPTIPIVTPARAREFAEAWGADYCELPELGHINTASRLGFWPQGLLLLGRLIERIKA